MIVYDTSVSSGVTKMERDDAEKPWRIVIASFFVQFIVCGITYSLGIFHIIFQDVFSQDHFDTSWAGSILIYVTALTSVMFRCFISKFGCRVSVMLGGLIAAAGLALSVVVTNLFQLYLTYSLMTGIGFGLACTPSIMIIEQHFHKQRFRAVSVAVAGVGCGIIAFPFIIEHLIEYYAWRGMLLILAGFAFNICVCGSVMSPVKKEREVRLLPLLSCQPLRNPIFHGLCISNFFWSFGSTIVYMYLPAYAIEEGTDFENSMLLIACIGIASFSSRTIFAFMGRKSALDQVTAILCSVGLGVVLTGIAPRMLQRYSGQIAYTIIFGFYSGYWTTFLSQASRELVGPEYIAMGNGYLCFMIAVGGLLGGPCAGILIQEEGLFKYAFYMAGASLIWSNVILLIFKFKNCVPLPSPEYYYKSTKVPLLDDNMAKPFKIQHQNGEQVLVDACISTV